MNCSNSPLENLAAFALAFAAGAASVLFLGGYARWVRCQRRTGGVKAED